MNNSHNKSLLASVDKWCYKEHLFLSSMLVVLCSLIVFISKPVFASQITENNILNLINTQRIENNLKPLAIDSKLDQAATSKSQDMLLRNYFEHFAFGLSPWDFIRNKGYDFILAGENLAMDFTTSEGVTSAWMKSKTHRDNILNPNFQDIGIGITSGSYSENNSAHETTMVSVLFGERRPSFLVVINNFFSSLIKMI